MLPGQEKERVQVQSLFPEDKGDTGMQPSHRLVVFPLSMVLNAVSFLAPSSQLPQLPPHPAGC